MNYGMPYKGSKNRIAYKLMQVLPAGKRFVDLFGGGGAMSHAAALSGKYDEVLYNEIEPHIAECFEKAISGGFRDFIPDWISRESFHEQKDKDGYIAICWSFGNNLRSYLYAAELEPFKRALHDFIVFGVISEELLSVFPRTALRTVKSTNYEQRRQEFKRLNRSEGQRFDCEPLERLARLQYLERLARPIQVTAGSYADYVYQPGDVVYCDIPYSGTSRYNCGEFDSAAFYAWAEAQPFPVYISEYAAPFNCVWEQDKTCPMSATKKDKRTTERLYATQPTAKEAAA